MTNRIKIGLDLMGSDHSPVAFFKAILSSANLFNDFDLVLLGTLELEQEFLKNSFAKNISFIRASESIHMDENPLLAIRRKKKSSMTEGMNLLKEKKIDLFISLGNTGAIIASCKMIFPLLTPFSKTALLTMLPTKKNQMAVIDVGANINSTSEHLLSFALMGFLYLKTQNMEKPRIGLLNIGSEAKKGTLELQKTYHLLNEVEKRLSTEMSFVGNMEGKEAFQGDIDLLVTDGFTGNIFLKTAEGAASLCVDLFQSYLKALPNQTLESKNLLSSLKSQKFALLLGVDALIMKCHGSSSFESVVESILDGYKLVRDDFLRKFKENITQVSSFWY